MAFGINTFAESSFAAITENPIVAVTGQELTIAETSPGVIIDVTVSLTGQDITITEGNVDIFAGVVAFPTGEALSANLGSVIANINADVDITGQELTATEGTLTLDANTLVDLTGQSLSVSLPSPLVFTGFGDAQISTAQSKFGGASLLLDGTGDYLESEGAYNFGSDPFTVDMWVRPTSGTQDAVFFDSRDSTSNDTIALRQSTDNLLVIRGNGTLFNINNVFSANTWVHIAVTRGDPFGNTYSVFVNGVKQGSTLFGATATAANIHIGSDFNGSNNWEGYIDELRVADVDEYGGTDFTPPTSAYTADGNIPILLHFDGANGSTTFTNDGIVQSVTVTANANVSVTGQELTMQENAPDVTGDANISLTGFALSASLGTAVLDALTPAEVTGQELTMQEGTATADDASAEITGLSMSMAQGSVKNVIWNPVDTGTIQPWTEVDTAA